MLLALGITVALPQGVSATVVGWRVTDWCAPVACVPTASYYDGMPRNMFISNSQRDCTPAVIGLNNTPELANTSGGFLNPPNGFFNSPKMETLRWVVGEPIVCNELGPTMLYWQFPMRWYRFDASAPWAVASASGTIEFGTGICGTGFPSCVTPTVTQTCLNSSNIVVEYTTSGGGSSSSVSASTYKTPNSMPKTTDGELSYNAKVFTTSGSPSLTAFRSATSCAKILALTLRLPTDTIGGYKDVQWSGARASNGVENSWSAFEELNCNIQNPPQECIGKDTTPYLISCGLVTIDPGTWGNLGPCILGTPQDYIKGVGALDEVMDMPLPGTGSCSPFDAGTMFDTPVVFDLCGWYPAARPIFDVLMTAGLWIAVVGSVFKTRTREGD